MCEQGGDSEQGRGNRVEQSKSQTNNPTEQQGASEVHFQAVARSQSGSSLA